MPNGTKEMKKIQYICFQSKLTPEVHWDRIWHILPEVIFLLRVLQTLCFAVHICASLWDYHPFWKYKLGRECLSRKCWKYYSNANYLRENVAKISYRKTRTPTLPQPQSQTCNEKPWIQIPFSILRSHMIMNKLVFLSKIQFHHS